MALLTNDNLALEVNCHTAEHGWVIYTVRFLINGQSIINPAVIKRSADYDRITPGYMMAEEDMRGSLFPVLDAVLNGRHAVWSSDEPHFVLSLQHCPWEGADDNSRIILAEAHADAYFLEGRDYFGSDALVLRMSLAKSDLVRFRDELNEEYSAFIAREMGVEVRDL